MKIKFKKLHEDAVIPQYQTDGASGFDLHSIETCIVPMGEIRLVRTGLSVELPTNCELQIRPRSGMSKRFGCYIANSPGTVDNDYRGEVMIMVKGDIKTVVIGKHDRIAQGVVAPVLSTNWVAIEEATELEETKRGAGGFGSTGV